MDVERDRLLRLAFLLLASLTRAQVPLEVQIFPPQAEVFFRGERLGPLAVQSHSRSYVLPEGAVRLTVVASGYEPRSFEVQVRRGAAPLRERLQPLGGPIRFVAEVTTGSQPKSVRFTPDGRYLAVALLDGPGVELFAVDRLSKVALLLAPGYSRQRGFVETWMFPRRRELWVSQMTTGMVHCFDLDAFHHLASFSTQGTWSKVILADPAEERAWVSNWSSRDVSVVDVSTRRVLHRIPIPGTPRGLALDPAGSVLLVSDFDSGLVHRFALADYRPLPPIRVGDLGAMRHLVVAGGMLYASDMASGVVFRLDPASGRIAARLPLGWNLNTIAVDPRGRYLFASSRGPNNPESYLLPGPEYGKVFVVGLDSFERVHWVWGRDQPTGLDVSPDGRWLAFTDFLSDRLELFRIREARPR